MELNPIFKEKDIKDLLRLAESDQISFGRLVESLNEKALEYFESKKPKEYILCAANHYDDGKKHVHQPINIESGFVMAGRRHHNCITSFAIMIFPYTPEGQKLHNTEIQGFMTNTNRFVGRKEAYKIAFEAKQIIGPNKDRAENGIGLTSEDLY